MALEVVGVCLVSLRALERSSGVTAGGFRDDVLFFFLTPACADGFLDAEGACSGGGVGDFGSGVADFDGGRDVEDLAGFGDAGGGEGEAGLENTGGGVALLLSGADGTLIGSDGPTLSLPAPMLPALEFSA
jgi:hypothetical protein